MDLLQEKEKHFRIFLVYSLDKIQQDSISRCSLEVGMSGIWEGLQEDIF